MVGISFWRSDTWLVILLPEGRKKVQKNSRTKAFTNSLYKDVKKFGAKLYTLD